MNRLESESRFENRFWLQILGDHIRFILTTLAPLEVEPIQQATYLKNSCDEMGTVARRDLSGAESTGFNRQALELAQNIRLFKLGLLSRSLSGGIQINLPPTFLNHMVNECEEYIRLLTILCSGKLPPPLNPVHYHLLWLKDAQGHAASLAADLDETEHKLFEECRTFMSHFQHAYDKTVELYGYQRTGLPDFPALARFNREAEAEMRFFKDFLIKLRNLRLSREVLARFAPLVPDHMDREECYYLIKLSQVANTIKPDCDPARPRVEGE